MKIKLENSNNEFEIDEADYLLVKPFLWYEKFCIEYNLCYAETKIDNKSISLHRFLLNSPQGHIDHIDGNGLNNRRNNLRLCTVSQNQMNRRKRKQLTSRYKGVYWDNDIKKWRAEIYFEGKKHVLGRTSSENEAARLYNKKAKEFFKEFAKENIIFDNDRTYPENYTKREIRSTSSKYKGVSLDKQRAHQKKKWVAHTRFNGKRIKIGRFETEEDAKKALDMYRQS